MSYPSHITNIYELLNEDGEPHTVRVNTGDQSKSTNQPRAQTSSTRGNAQGGAKPQGARDGQRRTNENRPPRQDNRGGRSIDGRKPNEVPIGGDFSQDAPVRRERGGERTRDSAHRATDRRIRGADQVGEFGGKRVFDRRSGTGRGREQKKGGAGRGNWGKEGEGENATEGAWDTEDKGEQKEGEKVEEVPEQKTPEQEERERLAREEQEKEDALITLDAYLKKQEAVAPKVELPTARKANEGVDQKELSKWGNYAVLKKDDDDEIVSKKESREKSGKNTVPVDQVFNVREPPRPRPEREDRGDRGDRGDRPFRGGRGGNRGGSRGGNRGGNRGGSRGGRGGESIPSFDLNSFPTLAPKA